MNPVRTLVPPVAVLALCLLVPGCSGGGDHRKADCAKITAALRTPSESDDVQGIIGALRRVRPELKDDHLAGQVDVVLDVGAKLKKSGGEKQMQGKTTLAFEDFKVVPGDIVSFYATASDAKNTARTDLMFAQAEPFDLRFKQSQQMGGGGGGGSGNESSQISERQKEIIAATWNELRNGAKDKPAAARSAGGGADPVRRGGRTGRRRD